MKKKLLKLIDLMGYQIQKKYRLIIHDFRYKDFEHNFFPLFDEVKQYTMTSPERLYAIYKAVEYIINSNTEGSFVECGVWKGGSAMMIVKSLLEMDIKNRYIFLYDTFEGMSKPSKKDLSANINSENVYETWEKSLKGCYSDWCYAGLEEVKRNMEGLGYPSDKIIYIKGKVEDTIPASLPEKIALLRLDTDWYESTYHELKHLYPLLVKNGVLIIDDYGYWKGSKEAVDQYFKEINAHLLLNRIDPAARLVIKT